MITKERILQVIEEMKVADCVWDLEDFDFTRSDWANDAWSELITRLWLDVAINDYYTNWICVWFSITIADKDGNREMFRKIIEDDFGFLVEDGADDEQVLTNITDVINSWKEQYEDIVIRYVVA